MADDADAPEHAVNGSKTASAPTVTRVRSLSEPAEAADPSDGVACPSDITSAAEPDQADDEPSTNAETTRCDDDQAHEQAEAADDTDDGDGTPSVHAPSATPGFRLALVAGLVALLALGGLAGWFGYGVYQAHQEDKMRNLFLAVGKQGALNLTTIDYTKADADIQRILDSSTGQFYDDFSKRAAAFVDVVKQAQAKTDGSIVEAGLESVNGNSARVLVAVLVTTSNKGATDQQPRHWRMRVDLQKVGDTVKVANVGFVP